MRPFALLMCAAALAACTAPADTPPEPGSGAVASSPPPHAAVTLTPQQEEGRMIFASVCWTCHGAGGHGDGPARAPGVQPPTFHTQDYALASGSTLIQRFQASLAGADPAHPHMQHVVKLVREESFAAALAYIPALAYPPEIPGSAIHGEEIYRFRCAGCHGQTGRGDGPGAASLVDVKPADFTADTLIAARNWDALFAKAKAGGDRVHGSTMPAWGTVLGDADLWDVVAYLATFQAGLVSPPRWQEE